MWPSLEDLQDIIRVTYRTINGRPISTFQQADVLALLSADCFATTYAFAIAEIDPSQSGATQIASSQQAAIQDAQTRGYLTSRPLTKTANPSVKERCSILYEVFVDLQASRIKTNTVAFQDMQVVPNCAELEADRREEMESKLKKVEEVLALKPDPNLTLVARLERISANKGPERWKELRAERYKTNTLFHLLVPNGQKKLRQQPDLQALVDKIAQEYVSRISVMLMRLEVTAQAFLYSERAKASYDEICSLLSSLNSWIENYKMVNPLSVYDLLTAPKTLLAPTKISGRSIPSALKKIQVGHVPNRGGVPEGFAALDVNRDVQKANVALQQKDARELQAKKAAEKEWIGGAAAVAAAPKNSVWKAPAGGSSPHTAGSGFGNSSLKGGRYHGFSEGYERRGRRRFPGMPPPSASRDELPDALPYIAQPAARAVAVAPTVSQSHRVVQVDHTPAALAPNPWSGGREHQSYTGWDPRY
eukprot:Protomagalhaensia_wolfi_Nauph_80__5690@NODE_670_length_2147_cov_15_165085_g497_i0_p1_GENE_NODE_670_length_2147_cov_15_165085_g497_i0NODE_670_length_2147_cov_15_165085_g497_i0_p1_ORF_typecomplete_len476_score102_06DUF2465/PF10239_9/4_3e24_NODE_670_length_2147_cov_15_165085_g497_i05631990